MPEMVDLNVVDASNTARWPEGMAPAGINDAGRADEGILARWYKDTDGSITSGGSSNAYTATSNRTISGLVNNTVIAFTANHTNTGAATFALNGLTAKAIRRPNGDALVAGDIVSGQQIIVVYKSSPDYWQLLTPWAERAVPARAYAEYTSNAAITTTIPVDDSIPQDSEGTEILSVTITLEKADSRVRLRFQGWGAALSSAADDVDHWVAAMFVDGTAAAIAAALSGPGASNVSNASFEAITHAVIETEVAPGTVGPHTYNVNVGKRTSTATFRMNGNQSGRYFGGVSKATLVAEEVFV